MEILTYILLSKEREQKLVKLINRLMHRNISLILQQRQEERENVGNAGSWQACKRERGE